MGSIVLYIIEWAFALLVLLAIYKAAFSGTTLHRFNRFYLLGATLLSALLPLVHISIPDRTPLVSEMSIVDTEFAQELSGTFMFAAEPQTIAEPYYEEPATSSRMWAIILVCAYTAYVLTLFIGWSRGIIRARRFLKGKPRRRLGRTVWLVTHDGSYGPFSWMNYIVISNTESGFARRASLRHEYSHVRLMHSIDLIILLACTIVNPACWLVLQEIKIVHEYEADDEVINRYGIQEQDYQRLLLIRTVGAEAYALASSFNLNIKKRIIMMNKNKTRKRRLMWLLLLIPLLGMTSVLFARTEKSLNLETFDQNVTIIVRGRVVDEKGKPIPNALITESLPANSVAVAARLQCLTDKNGQFSFSTIESPYCEMGVSKEGYSDEILKDYYGKNLVITLTKGGERKAGAVYIKQRNLMQITAKANGKVHAVNGVVDKDVDLAKLKGLVKEFIANPKNNSKLPLIEEYDVEGFKTIKTTVRYVIVLEREPGASIANRDAAYGVITNVLYELRDEWCRKEFGTSYEECTPDQQGYARAMYPNKSSMAETRYYLDVNLRIRKSAILAYLDKTDSMEGGTMSQPEEEGQLLGVIQALEKYLDDLTADGKSRIRSVNVILNDNADPDFVSEVKKVLRKKNVISIKYSAEPQRSKGQYSLTFETVSGESDFMVVPQTLKAGDIIHGIVSDADTDAPIMLAEIFELDANDRIRAHGVTDNNGEFSIRITDPNNSLKASANGYLTAKRPIANGPIHLRKDVNDEIFQGKTPETVQYIQDNINYPDEAKQDHNSNVLVSFTVGKDGNVMNPEIIGSTDPALDEEALKVLSQMPAWVPARNENGETIEVKYTIPVSVPSHSE